MDKKDIDFLISIQDLEQPYFDNACLERENKRLNVKIDRLNNVINELVLNCYNSDMSYREFEGIWQIAFNEKYNPDKIKELGLNND